MEIFKRDFFILVRKMTLCWAEFFNFQSAKSESSLLALRNTEWKMVDITWKVTKRSSFFFFPILYPDSIRSALTVQICSGFFSKTRRKRRSRCFARVRDCHFCIQHGKEQGEEREREIGIEKDETKRPVPLRRLHTQPFVQKSRPSIFGSLFSNEIIVSNPFAHLLSTSKFIIVFLEFQFL